MDQATRQQLLTLGHQAHALTEAAYQLDPAVRGGPGWDDKQRILLADMALHLLQTSLREGEINAGTLRNNLYAILTISAQFLPAADLACYANAIIQDTPA